MIRKCLNCEIEFDDKNEEYPNMPHTTCSLECAKELQNKKNKGVTEQWVEN